MPRLLFADGAVQRNVGPATDLRSIASEYLLGRLADPYRLTDWTEPAPSGVVQWRRTPDPRATRSGRRAASTSDYFMYVEDVELCRRLEEQGGALYYVPDAVMVHEGGVSSRPRAGELGEMLERHREDYVGAR